MRQQFGWFCQKVTLYQPPICLSQEIRSQFENCLADGSPLFVTDCDLAELAFDKRFNDALQNCSQFIHGKQRFKITVSTKKFSCFFFCFLFKKKRIIGYVNKFFFHCVSFHCVLNRQYIWCIMACFDLWCNVIKGPE